MRTTTFHCPRADAGGQCSSADVDTTEGVGKAVTIFPCPGCDRLRSEKVALSGASFTGIFVLAGWTCHAGGLRFGILDLLA
jgi:hypothetical protein